MQLTFGFVILCLLFSLLQAHTLFLRKPEAIEAPKMSNTRIDMKDQDNEEFSWFPKVQNQM